MTGTIAAVLAVVVGAIVVYVRGVTEGRARQQRETRGTAEAIERQRRERAALEAGEAMRTAARERDAALRAPADDVLTDAARRGGGR